MAGRIFIESSGRQGSRLVMDSSVVVSFVNRHCRVNNLWLDGLFLDHRLDVVMDVVVGALPGDGGCCRSGMLGFVHGRRVLEFGGILCQGRINVCLVTMLNRLVLSGKSIVGVLFRSVDYRSVCAQYNGRDSRDSLQDFLILERLHNSLMVILVDLLVDSGRNLFVLGRLDLLVHNGFSNLLVYRCLVLAIV